MYQGEWVEAVWGHSMLEWVVRVVEIVVASKNEAEIQVWMYMI